MGLYVKYARTLFYIYGKIMGGETQGVHRSCARVFRSQAAGPAW